MNVVVCEICWILMFSLNGVTDLPVAPSVWKSRTCRGQSSTHVTSIPWLQRKTRAAPTCPTSAPTTCRWPTRSSRRPATARATALCAPPPCPSNCSATRRRTSRVPDCSSSHCQRCCPACWDWPPPRTWTCRCRTSPPPSAPDCRLVRERGVRVDSLC